MEPVLDRMPHRGPMLWIDEVVQVAGPSVEARTTIRADHVLAEHGRVPALAAIELFAQAACALMAHRFAAGAPDTGVTGALLGTRRVDVDVDAFEVGDELTIVARESWSTGALSQFDCALHREGKEIARGSINVASGAPIG